MISVGNNKAVICKGDFHPAALYKGDKKIAGYSVEKFEGTGGVTLENCYNDKVYDAFLHGKNLLDVKKVYPDCANDEGGITVTRQTARQVTSLSMLENYKENTRYTFSCDYEVTVEDNGFYPVIQYTDGTITRLYSAWCETNTGTYTGHCKITTASNKTVSKLTLGCSSVARTVDVKLTNMQVVEGNDELEYEPACRNATITARGKNLFNIYSEREVLKGGLPTDSYKVENGVMSFKSRFFDTSKNRYGIKVYVKRNTGYYFRYRQLTGRVTVSVLRPGGEELRTYNGGATAGARYGFSFNSGESEVLYFSFRSNAWDVYTELSELMLNEGTTPIDCEPYTGYQTIPFENGELTANMPTFKGTTVIEVESDIPATISGKYKKVEV